MANMEKPPITLVGAGLVGSLLAIFLARRGYSVNIYERRADPRAGRHQVHKMGEGRSINLAISTRGLYPLELLGLKGKVLEHAIPMTGRMMHSPSGELTYQAYGQTSQDCINSISRSWLNMFLLDEAEKHPEVKIFFDHRLDQVDLDQKSFTVLETSTQKERKLFYKVLIGTDGSSSAARRSLAKKLNIKATEEELSHGYKEFVMPAQAVGQFKMEKNALHIWPRGDFMMIALPNLDASYTCTLFMRNVNSQDSFEKLTEPAQVQEFLNTHLQDFAQLVPDAVEQYFAHPTGRMVTLKCGPWNYKGDMLLMGDAAHAIVPFFGQGMNSGFEDVVVFDQLLEKGLNLEDVFTQFYASRKTNTDAIADMAVENLTEMSAKTADPRFLYQKKIEKILMDLYPTEYRSRYSMVSFSRVPYRLAYEAGTIQNEILEKLTDEFFPDTQIDTEKALHMIRSQLRPVMDKIDGATKG